MPRITKVVGVSLPPETYNKIERYAKENHKTRSEFYREMIRNYFSKDRDTSIPTTETDIANSLKNYWSLRSSSDLKIIIIGLGIITNKRGMVLIGARKGKDKWVENLTWVFPGGELTSLDFKEDILSTIERETNLKAGVQNLVSVRIHPDSGYKTLQIIALYFHCSVRDVKSAKPGGGLKELKWVRPLDVFRYFTTSTSDDVTKFLSMLDKSSI